MIDVVCLSLSGSPLAWQILSFIIHSSSHTLARSIRRGWGRGLSLNFFCPLDGRCRCTQPDIIQTARSFCPSGQLISVRPERPTESWQYLFGLPPRHICVLDARRLGRCFTPTSQDEESSAETIPIPEESCFWFLCLFGSFLRNWNGNWNLKES